MRLYRSKHCAHPAFFDMPGPAATTRPDELREYFHGVLLHFRQESGHYYWQVLVADDPVRLAACRDHFGDERRDYAQALRDHYHKGPPDDWQSEYVSPYASAHPWEDFAETWSQYLQLVALVAATDARGRALTSYPERQLLALAGTAARDAGFRALLRRWMPASVRAKRLRRRHGREAPHRFAPPPPVIRKMEWIHRLVQESLLAMQAPRLA